MEEKNNKQVADDVVVSLAYVLTVDGDELDRADDTDPLVFLHGHGNIIPGLERELTGLSVGDAKTVTVAPEDGYGLSRAGEPEAIPRDMLPAEYEPMIDDPLMLRDTESNEVFEVYVADFDDDTVRVVFDHPLAGKTLNFDVRILDLRPATVEELAHGHVHGPEGHHH